MVDFRSAAMRNSFFTFAIMVTLAIGNWSTASADSFKIVTAPTDNSASADRTGSSIKVVTAPRSAKEAQAAHTDETIPVNPSAPSTVAPRAVGSDPVEPVADDQQRNNDMISAAHERIQLTLGSVVPYKLDNTEFRDFIVSDPIITVVPRSTKSFIFIPKAIGRTSVLLFDKSNNLIKNIEVEVRGEVQIVNRPLFGSQQYRCWSAGCTYTDETKYERPAEVHVNK